jgi:hypothetical protein
VHDSMQLLVRPEGISECQIKGWQSCSPKQPRPLSSDAVAAKVQVGERRALREHRRQLPVPLIPDAVTVMVQVGERRALREHRRQPPRPLIFDAVVAKVQVGSHVYCGSTAASRPTPSAPSATADRSSSVTWHHSCSLPKPRSSSAIVSITAVCGALALTMLPPSLGIMLCGPCPASSPAPAARGAACLAWTLAAGFTRPIAARISFDTMPSINRPV